MQVFLDNGKIKFELDETESHQFGTYLIMLANSEKLTGQMYHDDIHNTSVITCYGANEQIYSLLTVVQDESTQNYFTIE